MTYGSVAKIMEQYDGVDKNIIIGVLLMRGQGVSGITIQQGILLRFQ